MNQPLAHAQRAQRTITRGPGCSGHTRAGLCPEEPDQRRYSHVCGDLVSRKPDSAPFHLHLALALYPKGDRPWAEARIQQDGAATSTKLQRAKSNKGIQLCESLDNEQKTNWSDLPYVLPFAVFIGFLALQKWPFRFLPTLQVSGPRPAAGESRSARHFLAACRSSFVQRIGWGPWPWASGLFP